jgi:hypothetical protein
MLRINYLSDTGTLLITVPVGNNVNNGKSSSHHVNIPHSHFSSSPDPNYWYQGN